MRGRPISRILSFGLPQMDDHSSTPPVTRRSLAANPDYSGSSLPALRRVVPIWHCSRWGLPCRLRCRSRGGLLPHRFTLTLALTNAHHRCDQGSLFSVALSLGLPPPGVTRHRAFWSPDFPRTLPPAAIQPSAHNAVRCSWRSRQRGNGAQDR